MEYIYIGIPVILGLWGISLYGSKVWKEQVYEYRRSHWPNRIVKLKKKFREKENIEGKYAKILRVVREAEEKDIKRILVELLPTERELNEEKKKWNKQQLAMVESAKKKVLDFKKLDTASWVGKYGYSQQNPQHYIPREFQSLENTRDLPTTYISLTDGILMPENYDYLNERLIKKINGKEVKQKMNRMPRIFRYLIYYIPVSAVVWDIVWNINPIVKFLVTTFISHK